jgi:hypothetical protein
MRRAFSLVMRKCEKMASLIKSVAVVGFWSRSWCLLRRRNKRVPGKATGESTGTKGKRHCTYRGQSG